jgi:hypothetical protein
MLACFNQGRRRAFRHAVSESFDIVSRHGRDLQVTQKRFDVAFNAPPIAVEGGGLLGGLATSQDAAGLGSLEVGVAQPSDGRGLARSNPIPCGISARDNFPENTLGLRARLIWRPGRAVTPDCRPSLSAVRRSILHDVRDRIAFLPTRAKA